MSSKFLSMLCTFFKPRMRGGASTVLGVLLEHYLAKCQVEDMSTLCSHLTTGGRRPSRYITCVYADPQMPHRPESLYKNAQNLVEAACTIESERLALYSLLTEYLHGLPPLDRDEILREHHSACSEKSLLSEKAADLITRLLWHALCWDAATR